MLSRITIEVNFEEGNIPVIQILHKDSDDVRDKLISAFLQSLSHTSRWGKILYMGNASYHPAEPIHRWQIIPIKPEELSEEIRLMEKVNETKNSNKIDA